MRAITVNEYADVAGIKLPTKHRIFPRNPDGQALRCIDDDVR